MKTRKGLQKAQTFRQPVKAVVHNVPRLVNGVVSTYSEMPEQINATKISVPAQRPRTSNYLIS